MPTEAETLDFLAQLEAEHKAAERPRPVQPKRRSRLRNFFDGFERSRRIGAYDNDTGWNSRFGSGGPGGGFRGARLDRLTEEWNPGTLGPNRLIRDGGRRLRERARDLVRNNPLAKSAVEAVVTNVIECGITPKPTLDDTERRKRWVRFHNRWAGLSALATNDADVAGDNTINELQALWLEEIIVAGGCLTHYVELPRRGRSIPLALELIPEERYCDHLDSFGANPKTANRVVNGMEIDQATGRTIAHLVHRRLPNDVEFDPTAAPLRLPAEQCVYRCFRHQIGQKRGYTLMHAVIVWLWALGYYTENELTASELKSSWAYMVLTDEHTQFDWQTLFDDSPASGATDIYGNTIERHEPGMIWRGAPGDDVKAVGPNVPGGDSLPWLLLMQRLIAIGMSLSYEEAVRDYSKGSFSSVRAASNADRKRFRRLQKFTITGFCNPYWGRFVQAAARTGVDGFPRPSQLAAELEEWTEATWSAPGWQSVNPKDDATADDIRLDNGTITRKEIVESRGGDIEEHFDQLQREQQMAAERGLSFARTGQPAGQPANQPGNPAADDAGETEDAGDTETERENENGVEASSRRIGFVPVEGRR